jgi:hypothetical protein
VWSTKFGIVFERVVETRRKVTCSSASDTHSSPQLPTVFALLHPLDEVSPVLAKHGKCHMKHLCPCHMQAVFIIRCRMNLWF